MSQSSTSNNNNNQQQANQQQINTVEQLSNTVEQLLPSNMSVSHTSTASCRGMTTTRFSDKQLRIAENRLKQFLFGRMNEETFEEEGGIVDMIGLPRDFYGMGKGIEFFSNTNRGLKEKKDKSSTTKAKNPYQAVEITYKKPAKGETNQKLLTNLKIDSGFAVGQPEDIQNLLKETLTYLKMYHIKEEELKANATEYKKSGMSSFKVRFNSKEHQEFLKTIFPDHEFLVSSVERLSPVHLAVWDFTLIRTENKSGSGGGSKSSYKTKYDNLVEWIRNGGSAEGLEEFLQSQEVLTTSAPTTPTRQATPPPTVAPSTWEQAEATMTTEETTEVAEVVEEAPKKRGRPKKDKTENKKRKTDSQ
jgi:hypothetical protein